MRVHQPAVSIVQGLAAPYGMTHADRYIMYGTQRVGNGQFVKSDEALPDISTDTCLPSMINDDASHNRCTRTTSAVYILGIVASGQLEL